MQDHHGNASWAFPVSQSIVSSLPSSPLTGGASAPTVAGRSTIQFGQAMIWPITFTQPAMDYPFFKKPVSTNVPTPQKGWGTPSACSSPLLKEPHTSPQDTLDLTKSLTDPSVLTEHEGGDDDDDEMPTPDRTDSSNIKDVCKIQGTCTPADIRQVEKRISAPVSCERAKACGALVKQHNSVSDYLTGKNGLGWWVI